MSIVVAITIVVLHLLTGLFAANTGAAIAKRDASEAGISLAFWLVLTLLAFLLQLMS